MSAPPSYQEVVQGQWSLSYVDFTPAVVKEAGVFSSPVYETFDILIKKANTWLTKNPNCRVKTCESIEVKDKSMTHGTNTEKSTYREQGKAPTSYVRCLRLWLVPNHSGDIQQLGYVNIVPACTDSGSLFTWPKFETFGNTIGAFNQMIKERPLPGRIINVETQDMKFYTWDNTTNPDKSYWTEHGKRVTLFLNVIRVFYEAGPPAHEQIGCADFVPNRTAEDRFFSTGDFEPFEVVVSKANSWIQQNPGLHVVNVQSIDYKLKSTYDGSLDTQRSLYRAGGKNVTYYVRIVRVSYTTRLDSEAVPLDPPVQLTYKTFMPAQLTTGATFSIPDFETQSETMKRAMAWLNYTGAKVVAAETVTVRMYSGHQHMNPEVTYTYNVENRAEYILYVLRVYINGVHQEPPANVLPALPEIQQSEDDCCCCIL